MNQNFKCITCKIHRKHLVIYVCKELIKFGKRVYCAINKMRGKIVKTALLHYFSLKLRFYNFKIALKSVVHSLKDFSFDTYREELSE